MKRESWLRPELVLPGIAAASPKELVSAAAKALSATAGTDASTLERSFRATLETEGFSVGSGVAIPHVEVPDAEATCVCLITTLEPVALATIDGRRPDIFFFVAARRDPRKHLLLLAHLARLAQSTTFREGLRQATTTQAVLDLVDAAEERHASTTSPTPAPATSHVLIVVTLSGEKLADAILLDLVDRGYDDGCILEAQSLREAAAHEVPLFAGFRDIFGDPGGRRVLLVEAPADAVEVVVDAVRRLCDEDRAADARLYVIPLQMRWQTTPSARPAPSAGH